MDMYSALADPTRRSILELLATNGRLSSTEISNNFKMSQPAISQHLKVLRISNLVLVQKKAQQRIYEINPTKITELEKWVQQIATYWNQRFELLDKVLAGEKQKLKGGVL